MTNKFTEPLKDWINVQLRYLDDDQIIGLVFNSEIQALNALSFLQTLNRPELHIKEMDNQIAFILTDSNSLRHDSVMAFDTKLIEKANSGYKGVLANTRVNPSVYIGAQFVHENKFLFVPQGKMEFIKLKSFSLNDPTIIVDMYD